MSADWTIPEFPPRPLNGVGSGRRVIVVGAGMAGLEACRILAPAGYDVTVLEASDRPGGRVHTVRDPFAGDQHAEAGACYIPSNHSYPIGLAKQFGLELVPLRHYQGTADQDYLRGTRVRDPGTATEWPVELGPGEPHKLPDLWKLYMSKGLDAVESGPDPRLPGWPPPDLAWLDALSLEGYLQAQGASPGAIAILRLGYLDLWGNGIDSVSALMLFRDMAMMSITEVDDDAHPTAPRLRAAHPAAQRFSRMGRRVPGRASTSDLPPFTIEDALGGLRQYNVKAGADALPHAMARGLGERVRYGKRVESVSCGAGVKVVCRNGDVFVADHVIMAVPTSVLRRIRFSPHLSEQKALALASLRETSVTRIYIQFSTRFYFYVDEKLSGVANTDLPELRELGATPGTWISDSTNTQDTSPGILDVYSVGPVARYLAGLSEEERVEYALGLLEKPFPGSAENYNGRSASWSWVDDDLEFGAYPYFMPTQLTAFLEELSRSEGPIHFAGDQTSALPGWMQGALESGLRAAREVDASD